MEKICMRDAIIKLWKYKYLVVALVIVCTVAGGLFGYKKGKEQQSEHSKNYDKLVEQANQEYNNNIENYDKNIANAKLEVEKAENQVRVVEDFNKNSIYMKLDPNNVHIQDARLLISTPDHSNENIITTELSAYVVNGAMYNDLSDTQSDVKYWADIVRTSTDGNQLHISLMQTSAEASDEYMSIIIGAITDHSELLSSRYGEINITTIENAHYVKADINIAYEQIKHKNNNLSYQQNLNNQKKSQSDQEKTRQSYIDSGVDAVIEAKVETADKEEIEEVNPKKSALKYGILGALAGLIIPFGVCFIALIVNDDKKRNG